ncbi:MAG: glycosyltransferase [Acidobacteriota bacterium]|nr:glycosyltransferase [Acidobacteriota bacterium]
MIRSLYRRADKNIFTVPLDAVPWLSPAQRKAAFIPIGANVPEQMNRRSALASSDEVKTVVVFGVTGAPQMEHEVREIAGVMRKVNSVVKKLRLVVIGRGALEAKAQLATTLMGSNVELVVRGVLPAEEVAQEFEYADALLFVRGPLTITRGSALAAIASGVPVVGFRGKNIMGPLEYAGIEWAPCGDPADLARALTIVLTDPMRWKELHERNIQVQRKFFSWTEIAERFAAELTV